MITDIYYSNIYELSELIREQRVLALGSRKRMSQAD